MDTLRRLLGTTNGWFFVTLAEYLVLIALFRWLWPDGAPDWAGIALLVGVVAALTVVNVRLAKRLRRR
jgi:hypothetical protein